MSKESSYKQIVKSTSIFGGAQIIVVFIGIIRTKILAILLGPIGVGISGLYQSIIELIKNATGFGISYSAVREVASSGEDHLKVSKIIKILRRWFWVTGIIGMLLLVLFSKAISTYAFGDTSYSSAICVLSVIILLSAITSGQIALLQGLRKIKEMALATITGSLLGFVLSVIVYWSMGIKGIVPALILIAGSSLLSSWYFSRKITTIKVDLSIKETFIKGKSMIVLGLFVVVTAFTETITVYLVRSFIARESGLVSVGYFMGAWSISTIYLSAILNAMGADYFPRLSSIQNNQEEFNRRINEQTEVALLIAGPVIIGMISFISLIINLFYSAKFHSSASILSWQLMGDFFKLIAWPLGFALLAKGLGKGYVFVNLLWSISYCLIVFFTWGIFGLDVTGIAFLFSYFISCFVIVIISKRRFNFSWSPKVILYFIFYFPLILCSFLSIKYLTGSLKVIVGTVLSAVSIFFSFWQLKKSISFSAFINRLKPFK